MRPDSWPGLRIDVEFLFRTPPNVMHPSRASDCKTILRRRPEESFDDVESLLPFSFVMLVC